MTAGVDAEGGLVDGGDGLIILGVVTAELPRDNEEETLLRAWDVGWGGRLAYL